MANTPIIIHVQATRQDRRVAFAQDHPDHPGGQAWVVGDGRVVAIALTAEASAALGNKDIERVAAPEHPGLPNEELPNPAETGAVQNVSPVTGNQITTPVDTAGTATTGDTGAGDTGGSDTGETGAGDTGKSGMTGKGGSKKG